ncbi:MAG: GTP-binding protein, partial [Fervidicoccaceae archaeon]|nr:GTP-binding protein [Fervidicoccaceae archaeon]
MSQKPHLNLVIIGHVDHGKSTMVGHILYRLGYIDLK